MIEMFEPCRLYNDSEFVSIDLNDDNEICEICNQTTNEKITHVILNDEFILFEGSSDKHAGRVTKAHQHCLQKWADIIQRNLQLSNSRSNSPSLREKCEHETLNSCLGDETSVEENKTVNISPKKYSLKEMENFTKIEIFGIVEKLENAISELSLILVKELQSRDQLIQEISAQKSHIEQLVQLQKNLALNT